MSVGSEVKLESRDTKNEALICSQSANNPRSASQATLLLVWTQAVQILDRDHVLVAPRSGCQTDRQGVLRARKSLSVRSG